MRRVIVNYDDQREVSDSRANNDSNGISLEIRKL